MPDFSDLVNQINADSGALGGLSAVAHKFEADGQYSMGVLQAGIAALVAEITVASPPGAGDQVQMPHIDLSQVVQAGADALAGAPQIVAGAYALFHAPLGQADHAVVVTPAGAAPGDTSAAFDSRELGLGDVFATTLIRPGTYTVTNTLLNTTGQVTVSYPVVTPGTPYQPPDPVTIQSNEDGFAPDSVTIKPAQGLIFQINARARVTVELTTPDDGPPT
jgi:hypothetical protein